MSCKDCTCGTKQDFVKCNCVKLYHISYMLKGRQFSSNYKYKSIVDFKRYCELNNLPYAEYEDVRLID